MIVKFCKLIAARLTKCKEGWTGFAGWLLGQV